MTALNKYLNQFTILSDGHPSTIATILAFFERRHVTPASLSAKRQSTGAVAIRVIDDKLQENEALLLAKDLKANGHIRSADLERY